MSLLPMPDRRKMSGAVDSPALYRGDADAPAFEVKFLLTEADARAVEFRLRETLTPDAHGDPKRNGAYRVTSVYFDTAAFDVFHRSKGYRRRKYRVRRYGAEPTAFLEQKTKKEKQVRKRRTAIPLEELPRLAGDVPADWPGAWFAAKLASRGLRPVSRVSYDRVALVGSTPDGPIRVTFDRVIVGQTAAGATPDCVDSGMPLLTDEVITEMKFLGAMPAVFKDVVEGLRLSPQSVSKYRRCVDAVGLAASRNGHV